MFKTVDLSSLSVGDSLILKPEDFDVASNEMLFFTKLMGNILDGRSVKLYWKGHKDLSEVELTNPPLNGYLPLCFHRTGYFKFEKTAPGDFKGVIFYKKYQSQRGVIPDEMFIYNELINPSTTPQYFLTIPENSILYGTIIVSYVGVHIKDPQTGNTIYLSDFGFPNFFSGDYIRAVTTNYFMEQFAPWFTDMMVFGNPRFPFEEKDEIYIAKYSGRAVNTPRIHLLALKLPITEFSKLI